MARAQYKLTFFQISLNRDISNVFYDFKDLVNKYNSCCMSTNCKDVKAFRLGKDRKHYQEIRI